MYQGLSYRGNIEIAVPGRNPYGIIASRSLRVRMASGHCRGWLHYPSQACLVVHSVLFDTVLWGSRVLIVRQRCDVKNRHARLLGRPQNTTVFRAVVARLVRYRSVVLIHRRDGALKSRTIHRSRSLTYWTYPVRNVSVTRFHTRKKNNFLARKQLLKKLYLKILALDPKKVLRHLYDGNI